MEYLDVVAEDEENRPDSVGKRINALAKARGIKPKQLEPIAGLDRGSIAKLLRGERDSTSFEAGLRIARYFKVDPYSLLPETMPPAADGAETESHLNEPVATALRLIREELVAVKAIAVEARSLARESAPTKSRRSGKTA